MKEVMPMKAVIRGLAIVILLGLVLACLIKGFAPASWIAQGAELPASYPRGQFIFIGLILLAISIVVLFEHAVEAKIRKGLLK